MNNPDATRDDACPTCSDAVTTGPVKVFAIANNALVANADVIFQNADDSLVTTLKTDATGTVQANMLAGGSVTVIMPLEPRAVEQEVFTWVGVKPGDELLTERKPAAIPNKVPRVFNLPNGGAGARYAVETECGRTSNADTASVTVQLDEGCTSSNVFVTVRGATPSAFYIPNLTIPAGVVDLSTRLYVRSKMITTTLTNVPTFLTGATSSAALLEGKLQMTAPDAATITFPTPLAPTTMATALLPNVTGPDAMYVTSLQRSSGASQFVVERAGSDAYTLDLAVAPLPWLLAAPAIDLAAKAAVWTESNDGSAETIFMNYRVTRMAGPSFNRQVISPYVKNQARIPQLPPPGDAFNLLATDAPLNLSVQLAVFPGGFDAVRAIAFTSGSFAERLATRGRFVSSSF
ncbi:MAG: hypothetical protein KBG15_20715 [Kofleriaceae bacterium]|nr:hypothetical protein [Kofleriaceae bacterium]